MSVRTLSPWVDRLLRGPITIECPYMEILGHDHEPPIFTGPGHIKIAADTQISFFMHGTPRDDSGAFRRLVQAQEKPYEIRHQFRVKAIGYDGTDWSGGWTKLVLGEARGNVWQLFGPIRSLHTDTEGFGVSDKSSVELVYDCPLRLPIPMNMTKAVYRDDKEVFWSRTPGTKTVEVVDTTIEFYCSAEREHVWAVADTSATFPHPYLENWISEPLNLLLGEVVYPRLYARNFGNGKAFIVLGSSSGPPANSLTANILSEDPLGAGERFWNLYRDILTVIAMAKDSNCHSNFEAHPLTRYYWEIIQATRGTNWVLCMTLASVVEGIVKMMFSEAERKSDWPEADIDNLKHTVTNWKGSDDLRSVVINYLGGFKTKGIAKTLGSLKHDGTITSEQISAWKRIRNTAMHGGMAIPWPDEEQNGRILSLIELTHRLSEAYIKRELEKQRVGRAEKQSQC